MFTPPSLAAMSNSILSTICRVSGNPDIAGIGVRSAIYAQNMLCFLLALWALWDGNVTSEELEHAEMQTTTNLVLAFAILISSIVQALTYGISSYHGNIVLMMSWMNNTNAFVYFILYVHHKTGLSREEGGVPATWNAWMIRVKRLVLKACRFFSSENWPFHLEIGVVGSSRKISDQATSDPEPQNPAPQENVESMW